MNSNSIFRPEISYKMKLIGMTLIAAFVGFITFYDTNMTFSKLGLIIGVVFSFIIFKMMASRGDEKDGLELGELRYYEGDESGLDLEDQLGIYNDDELV